MDWHWFVIVIVAIIAIADVANTWFKSKGGGRHK